VGAVAVGAISAHAAGGCRTTCAASSSAPQSTVLDQVTTVGRVRPAGRGVRYTWPGVYFEGRFRGTGVGLMLKDSVNDYGVQVDGATVGTLMRPGETTYWVRNLAAGNHTVRLTKRTESPWTAGEFDGLVPAADGAILALGLDHLGCDRHPSRHDHRLLAAALTKHLAALPLAW
jgi:hypothetical protein